MQGHANPYYPLKDVKALVRSGNWDVNEDALDDAATDFEWTKADIAKTILALRPDHFDISDWSRAKPGVMLDCYKARKLRGENVYTHFYIENKTQLVVNSFKRL